MRSTKFGSLKPRRIVSSVIVINATWQEKDANLGLCRYAYVEFVEPSLVAQALVLNESVFKGRNLKVNLLSHPSICALSSFPLQVVPKRTNVPGMQRGRGGRGGGRGRGGFFGGGRGGGYSPRGGYRGGYRGNRGRGFTPY